MPLNLYIMGDDAHSILRATSFPVPSCKNLTSFKIEVKTIGLHDDDDDDDDDD